MKRRTWLKAVAVSLAGVMLPWPRTSVAEREANQAARTKVAIDRVRRIVGSIEADWRANDIDCRWRVANDACIHVWYTMDGSTTGVVAISYNDAEAMDESRLKVTLQDGINESSWKSLAMLDKHASNSDLETYALVWVGPKYVPWVDRGKCNWNLGNAS